MKRNKLFVLFALLVSILLCSGCASSPTATNHEGGQLKVAATSVAICNILDELGYENVVGVPETSATLPENYQEVETIGSPMNPDLEIISRIGPDLLLAPASLESSLGDSFSTAGIQAEFLDFSSVEGLYASIEELGNTLDCEEAALKISEDYAEKMETFSQNAEGELKVLILMAFPGKFYLIATEDSYVGNLAAIAGAENVYDERTKSDSSGFVNINPEDMVQTNPDYILVFAHYAEDEAFSYMEKEFAENDVWQYFDAVKEGKIIYLPSDSFGMSATLQWADSVEYLQEELFGGES